MFCGKFWTGAPGRTEPMFRSIKASNFGGGIRALIELQPQYTERFLGIVAGGIFLGSKRATFKPLEVIVPATPGNSLNSLYIEDLGRMSEVPEETVERILGNARRKDAVTSRRLEFEWDNVGKYKQTAVFGDTQVTGITVTGARLGVNVGGVEGFPFRGRLYYTLENAAGIGNFVRWWADTTLVAEGYGVSSGETITCNEVNGSGISVVCTYAYSSNVKRGTAWLDLKWHARYRIYWAIGTITYSNPPQDTLDANGSEKYSYISAEQAPGIYTWNVVGEDDEGQAESSPVTPVDSITLNTIPPRPVITSVTQLSPYNFRVAYTIAAGPSVTCYFSRVNSPINFGYLTAGPSPVAGGPTFADITVPAFTPQDNSMDYSALLSSCDSAASALNTAFNSGPGTGVPATFLTQHANVKTAVATFAAALGFRLEEIKDTLKSLGDSVYAYASSIDAIGLSSADWKTQMGIMYGDYLAALGRMLNGNGARYQMPNGAVAGSSLAGQSVGSSVTSFNAESDQSEPENLYSIAQPFLKPNLVRIVVRATTGGVEESNNAVYELELDGSGVLKNPAPPPAVNMSTGIVHSSGTTFNFTVRGAVRDDGFDGVASSLDVYIHDATVAFDPSTAVPDANVALPSTGLAGARSAVASFSKSIASGLWRRVIILAKTAAGRRSDVWEERVVYISNDTPLTVGNLKGRALKSRGV